MTFLESAAASLRRMSDLTWPLVLICVALLLMTPGFFSVPPVDRDETRFAQASRQMVATGDLIDIRFQDGTRYKKPIGIYWLQTAAVNLVNTVALKDHTQSIWAYRLPSLFAAILSVLLTYWVARAFLTPFAAGLSALLMAFCIVLGFEARVAKTDAALLATILVAQGVLARAWHRWTSAIPLWAFFTFWGAMAFGVLLKGPIIGLVVGLTLLALIVVDRSLQILKRLKPLSGFALMIVLAAPWFIAIGVKSEGAFFIEAGLVDFLGKVASVQESHGGPPGLYAAVVTGTFWPASLFFLAAIPFLIKNSAAPVVVFAAAWVIPSWLVFEFTPTKLPHYVLPLYPALAMVTAFALDGGVHAAKLWQKGVATMMFAVPVILGAVAFGGLIYFEEMVAPFVLIAALVSAVFGFLAWRSFFEETGAIRSVLLVGLSAASLYLGVYQFAFPNLQTLWISNRMITLLDAVDRQASAACPKPSVLSVGYTEPSLAFLGPMDLRFALPDEAARLMKDAPCRLVFITGRQQSAFAEELAEVGHAAEKTGSIEGLTLNGGDEIEVFLFRSKSQDGGS